MDEKRARQLVEQFREKHPEIVATWQQFESQIDNDLVYAEVQADALGQYDAAQSEIRDIMLDLDKAYAKQVAALTTLKCQHHEWVPLEGSVLGEVECVHCKWKRLTDGAS